MKDIDPIPEGQRIFPYLGIQGAAAAISFYTEAFGATEHLRLDGEDGKIMHAELSIDGLIVMLADEFPQAECISPSTLGGTSVSINIFVADVDQAAARAQAAGAKLMRPIKDEFFGERVAWLKDPFGHKWALMSRIEALTPKEIKARFQKMMQT